MISRRINIQVNVPSIVNRLQNIHILGLITELIAFSSSGTKNEDNDLSIKKAGVNAKDSGGFLVEKEGSLDKPSAGKVLELSFVDSNVNGQEDTKPVIKPEIDEMLDPTKSSIASRTDDWIQLITVNGTNDSLTNIQLESANDQRDSIIGNEYLSPIAFELPKNEKDNWDAINTFENTETDSFDLLSYLCDVSYHQYYITTTTKLFLCCLNISSLFIVILR